MARPRTSPPRDGDAICQVLRIVTITRDVSPWDAGVI